MLINVNGIELCYEVMGQGEPLIMLHGNGETHDIFKEAADVLKEYFTVYLIDTRGHGGSTKLGEYHYQDMADDIKAFVTQLGLKNAVLYGFSDGGIIGLLLACRTELFRKYIVSGANSVPNAINKPLKLYEKISYFFRRDPLLKLMIDEPNIPEKDLRNIKAEVVLLAGSRDVILESHTRYLHSVIPGSKLEILPGRTHGSYIVHSTEIAGLIMKYAK